MKKGNSEKQGQISSFFFAVYPYSLTFPEISDSQFILYLEKNLQILARFPSEGSFVPQQKETFFNCPEKVTSFRIISEKKLSYQWSLYRQKISQIQTHEEFVESHQIDLSQFWSDFNSKKERSKQSEITFKKVRCKFSFLIAVGNQKEILQNIQKPFLIRKKAKDSINIRQLSGHEVRRFQPEENSASSENNKGLDNGNSNQRPQVFRSQTIIAKNEPEVQESPQSGMFLHKTFSYEVLPKDEKSQEESQDFKTPVKNLSPTKKNEQSGIESLVYSQLKLHLSLSEIQISKDIQQRIKDTNEVIRSPNKQSNGVSDVMTPSVHDELMAKYRKEKMGRITSSQILNQRGQIIVTPFYHHPKYFFIIIVVIAIFIGLISVDPQSRSNNRTPNFQKPKKIKGRVASHKQANKKQK